MPNNYTPASTKLTGDIVEPIDGELRSVAGVTTMTRKIADGTKYLTDRMPSTTLSLSADRVRLAVATAAGGASPALGALGTLKLPLATELENSDTQLGVIVAKTVILMPNTMLLYMPLDELVRYHGYTIAACVMKVKGAAGHGALPAGMPRISLVRFGASANAGLLSTTWQLDTAANVAAYEVEHDITLTPDQNAVIDCSQYQYALLAQNEYNANALVGLQFRRIVLTLTAP